MLSSTSISTKSSQTVRLLDSNNNDNTTTTPSIAATLLLIPLEFVAFYHLLPGTLPPFTFWQNLSTATVNARASIGFGCARRR